MGNVVVEGNEKTGSDLIIDAAELLPGTIVDDSALAAARQRILNKRIFADVQIDAIENGDEVDVHIVVKERWTLLPIPFFASSDGDPRGGLFLLESNLLGRMKIVALGGTLSTLGGSAFGFYQDPSIFGSRWAMRTSVLYSAMRQQQYDGAAMVYAYRDTREDIAMAIGYQLATGLFVYSGAFYVRVEPDAYEAYVPPAAPRDVVGPTAEIEWRAADYHSYFDEGVVLRAQHRQGVTGRRASQTRLSMQLSTRTMGDQSAIVFLQYAGMVGDPVIDAQRLGGQTGTRGFKYRGLWTEHAATATLEYQIPVVHFGFGTWTFNPFSDGGWIAWKSESTVFLNPGIGTRFYLKNVALPAVGVDVAYSTGDERLVVSGSIGMTL